MDDIRTYFLQSFLPGIFLTLLFYCLPVAAFKYHFNSPVSPRRAKIVSAGFAAISYVLLSVLLLSLSSNAVHASVAWIWCLINYKALTSGYSSLEEYAYQFPYEKRTVYSVSDGTPPGKYLVFPTGELANVIVTDTRSSGSKTEEVIDVKSEREIKLIPGRRVACFNCEMKLKSTTKKTSNFFQRLRDKTIFATNPEKKVAYDYKSNPENNAEKTVNKEEFKTIFNRCYKASLPAIEETDSNDPEFELFAAMFAVCDFAALSSQKERVSIAHLAMNEIASVVPDIDTNKFNSRVALYGQVIRGQKKLRRDWDVLDMWGNKNDAASKCAIVLSDLLYCSECAENYDNPAVFIGNFSECCEYSMKTVVPLYNNFNSLYDSVCSLREQKKIVSDAKTAVVASAAPAVEEQKEAIAEAKEEFKVVESASDERSDSELNCKEYKISPDYPAGTYYVISNGERPHLMVVDTKGNTEKRKYYKVTNVFKVKLKPNRIVKCVDCELRK